VLRGVVIDGGPRTLRIVARAAAAPPTDRLGADVSVEITYADRPGPPLYRATIELGDRAPEAPAWPTTASSGLGPFPLTLDRAYGEWLFHGPRFRNITAVVGIGGAEISGAIAGSSPRDCMAGAADGAWLIDPVALDCGLQLVLLWSRAVHDMTPLPTGLGRYRRYDRTPTSSLSCHVRSRVLRGGHSLLSDLVFVGADGRIAASVEELGSASSRALNRLSAHSDRSPFPVL
jgi:hypothetical protein